MTSASKEVLELTIKLNDGWRGRVCYCVCFCKDEIGLCPVDQ